MTHPEGDVASGPHGDDVRRDAHLPDPDWLTIPAEFERGAVAAPSGQLAWIALGDPAAPRVVLVPGATGSKEDFLLLMPLLAEAGYRVESFDLAGQYESAGAGPENLDPPQNRYTLDLFVDDLVAVLRSGAAPAHLLGYSFAGTVAAEVTVRHPELVSTLTLSSAPPAAGQSLRGFRILGPLSTFLSGEAIARLLIWGVKRNFNRAPRHRNALVQHRFTLTRADSVGDIMGIMKNTPDLDAGLRASGVPILLAIGVGDIYPLADHRAYAARIGARLAVFRTGHSPCEGAPHQLSAAMIRLFRNADHGR